MCSNLMNLGCHFHAKLQSLRIYTSLNCRLHWVRTPQLCLTDGFNHYKVKIIVNLRLRVKFFGVLWNQQLPLLFSSRAAEFSWSQSATLRITIDDKLSPSLKGWSSRFAGSCTLLTGSLTFGVGCTDTTDTPTASFVFDPGLGKVALRDNLILPRTSTPMHIKISVWPTDTISETWHTWK